MQGSDDDQGPHGPSPGRLSKHLGERARLRRSRGKATRERDVQAGEEEEHTERRYQRRHAQVDGDEAVDQADHRDRQKPRHDGERQDEEELVVGQVHHDRRERERLPDGEVDLTADEQQTQRRRDDHVRYGVLGEREDVLLGEERGVRRLKVERKPHEDDENARLPHTNEADQQPTNEPTLLHPGPRRLPRGTFAGGLAQVPSPRTTRAPARSSAAQSPPRSATRSRGSGPPYRG